MSKKAKQIHERYLKNYVNDEQLKKYLQLKIITEKEYNIIYNEKHEH